MPLVIFLLDEYQKVILIKINGNDVSSALSSIKKIWNGRMMDRPFEYHFLDEEYDRLYKTNRIPRVYSVLFSDNDPACVSWIIWYRSYNDSSTYKEIGIRKIMGATSSEYNYAPFCRLSQTGIYSIYNFGSIGFLFANNGFSVLHTILQFRLGIYHQRNILYSYFSGNH